MSSVPPFPVTSDLYKSRDTCGNFLRLVRQLLFVEAGLSQFAAHVPANWSLAGLPVSAAISFAPLP